MRVGYKTDILGWQALDLVERLGGRWSGGGGLCRCPAHEDRSPSLSVRAGAKRLLLHCFAGCSAGRVLEALKAQGLLLPGSGPAGGRRSTVGDRRSVAAARRIWDAGRAIDGTLASRYLARRGISSSSPEL